MDQAVSPAIYFRHRPEQSLLYKIVQVTWPSFVQSQKENESYYPSFVEITFDEYLKCGIPEFGIIRLYCKTCRHSSVLAFSCKRRGFCPSCHGRRQSEVAIQLTEDVLPKAPYRQWVLSLPFDLRYHVLHNPQLTSTFMQIFIKSVNRWYKKRAKEIFDIDEALTGSITFIQRSGSALNSNPHYHTIFLDGVYYQKDDQYLYKQIPKPSKPELQQIVDRIYSKALKVVKKMNLDKNPFSEDDGRNQSGQLAMSAGRGHKKVVEELVPVPYGVDFDDHDQDPMSAKSNGFSLNAKVHIATNKPKKLEKLIRYVARGPFALDRLKYYGNKLGYTLKTPWRNGATHVTFTPISLIQKLVALIPPPRANLVRYHGIFAPNFKGREKIVPKKKTEKANKKSHSNNILWAELIQKTFAVDATLCKKCQGKLEPIAVIKDLEVIKAILNNLSEATVFQEATPSRGPPDEFVSYQQSEPSYDQRPTDW